MSNKNKLSRTIILTLLLTILLVSTAGADLIFVNNDTSDLMMYKIYWLDNPRVEDREYAIIGGEIWPGDQHKWKRDNISDHLFLIVIDAVDCQQRRKELWENHYPIRIPPDVDGVTLKSDNYELILGL
jgi:hypothetical protein